MTLQNPEYPFILPKVYYWLLDKGLVCVDDNSDPANMKSRLWPWYFIDSRYAQDLISYRYKGDLTYPFARRYDTDECATFVVRNGAIKCVVVIEHQAGKFEFASMHKDMHSWLHTVIDDIVGTADQSISSERRGI